MKLTEIELKIAKYQKKLEEKTKVRGKKGRMVLKGIPGHLRIYINNEIDKLEKLKQFQMNQKTEKILVNWNDVRFENRYIKIRIDNYYSEPFHLTSSRKSLEFLKPYLIRANLGPIRAKIRGNKIISIENDDILLLLIEILSFKDTSYDLSNKTEESVSYLKTLIKNISRTTNKDLADFFKLSEKSKYLEFLCDLQSEHHKIIPLIENQLSSAQDTFSNDTFLFSISTEKYCIIVWESVSINKATYVFRVNNENYFADLQNIFDFIVSGSKRKRSSLRRFVKTSDNPINAIGVIDHDNLDKWSMELDEIIQQHS